MSDGGKKPTAGPTVAIGSYIGPYRIERRLGRGGMGEVYLAFDERLERRVAIKRIRRDKRVRRELRDRLRREARAVARLSHPAVAQVHDVVLDDAGDAIVMEYVEGRTVARLLADGAVDGGLAINVAIQVAQGLAAAHQLGMVHRDLKAENVMVTPAGRAKILDFGLVKHSAEATREDLTLQGMLIGTVGSMSPEQASGRRVDARSDLFSLGILLYELFTGLSPFRRHRWFESLKSVRGDRQTPVHQARPEVPAELSHLIDWLLRKEPELRPQSTRQVVDLLARIAATTNVGRLPPPPARAARERPSDDDGSTTPASGWSAFEVTPTAVALTRAGRWKAWLRRWRLWAPRRGRASPERG